jgi:hypothetical protein
MYKEYNPSMKSKQSVFLIVVLAIVIVLFSIIITNQFGLKEAIGLKSQDDLLESNIYDCNKDISCFINSIETKKKSQFLYEFTDSNGLFNINYKINFKLNDCNNAFCKLNFDVLDINSSLSEDQRINLLNTGLSDEEIDSELGQINSINITLVGIKQECNFNEMALLEVFNFEGNLFSDYFNLDQNTYSGTDYNCVRIYN